MNREDPGTGRIAVAGKNPQLIDLAFGDRRQVADLQNSYLILPVPDELAVGLRVGIDPVEGLSSEGS